MAHSGCCSLDPTLTTECLGRVELNEKMSFIFRLAIGVDVFTAQDHTLSQCLNASHSAAEINGFRVEVGSSAPLFLASRSIRKTAGPTVLLPL